MKDTFDLFYAVLFGALLSAEIAAEHFKIRPPRAGAFSPAWAYVWRIGWLVGARAFYFAYVSSGLDMKAVSWASLPLLGPLAALLLCAPILGFQQLSYVDESPPRWLKQQHPSWVLFGLTFGGAEPLLVAFWLWPAPWATS